MLSFCCGYQKQVTGSLGKNFELWQGYQKQITGNLGKNFGQGGLQHHPISPWNQDSDSQSWEEHW